MPYDTNSITYVTRESCYSLNGLFTSASLKRCCFHDNRMYNNKKKREKLDTQQLACVCLCVLGGGGGYMQFFTSSVSKLSIGQSFNNISGKNFIST